MYSYRHYILIIYNHSKQYDFSLVFVNKIKSLN